MYLIEFSNNILFPIYQDIYQTKQEGNSYEEFKIEISFVRKI